MRKTLINTIRMYHEDKKLVQAHGQEWHLLCREITKLHTAKYEIFKERGGWPSPPVSGAREHQ